MFRTQLLFRFLFGLSVVVGGLLLAVVPARAQGYRIERIASGLNQPSYVTQAPGDPANVLYFTERTDEANPGFGASNNMGKVWRYNVNTRSRTLVYDFDRFVTNDTGLHTIAFHPDFNVAGSDGYGKMYASSSEASGTAVNRVEELTVDLSGPNPTYEASYSRLLLQYNNNTENNHTVNWIGFDPTANSSERDYLYISTGDGSFNNSYNGGQSPDGRPSQNPADIAGKMLRIDVGGADAYAGDPLKNFAVPANNPIPTYNAANPGTPIDGLGEVWLTGLRNVYRASFDRETGDLWMGDVGEVDWEEVSFLKADTNTDGPPVDYGWPQREGTSASEISGAPSSTMNPFTGVTSLEPLQQFPHDGGGEAVIGGYLYRGPIEELQGKYIYGDFVTTGNAAQFWTLDFDRDTHPANYNGDNGVNTDVSALWQSLVVDTTDPSYGPDSSTGSSAGLDHVVSFGEDNDGNVYLVDFGNGFGFNGQYPGPGRGEIFRLTPYANLTITVNRDTGEITLRNDTGEDADILGYRISSMSGAIDPESLTAITGRLDNSASGSGSFDPDNAWQITSDAGDQHEFSESSTGSAASMDSDEAITLSPPDLDHETGAWIRSIYEDFQLQVTLGNSTTVSANVVFVGNGGEPFGRSDLNFNGELDAGDWALFKQHHSEVFSDLTIAESYGLGDLDGDGDNDFDDFRLFQNDYVAVHGLQAFSSLIAVPEPATLTMLAVVGIAACLVCRRPDGSSMFNFTRWRRSLLLIVGGCTVGWQTASADLVHQYKFNDGTANDSVGAAHGVLLGGTSTSLGIVDLPGGNDDYIELPGSIIEINDYVDATFEAWFTYRGGGSWQRVFDFGSTFFNGEGRDYVFFTPASGSGDTRAAITDGGNGGEDVVVGGGALNTNQTYHVAVVIDDSSSDEFLLYLNGNLAGSTSLSVPMSELDNDNAYLGNSNWSGDASLNGTMDEFRIYDHALSPQEVLASFAAGPVPLGALEVEVNTVTGTVAMINKHFEALNFDYYRLRSESGTLDPTRWLSLEDQGVDESGGGGGESWEVLGQPTPEEVIEGFLLGGSILEPGETIGLGNLYNPSILGRGENGDITFSFALKGQELITGNVNHVTPDPLAGDFNGDQTVDAADYTIWRDTLGSTANLAADGDGDLIVDHDDYVIWAWSFGNQALDATVSASAVPEPTSGYWVLLTVVACGARFRLRRPSLKNISAHYR